VAARPLADSLQDRYVLERELGRGGMATVYLARDVARDRPVALKVLHPELAATLGPERFLREIKLAARLQHPHVLTVFDSGDAAGQLWYTMPYVEGESLRGRLRRETQLPLNVAIEIARQVALALDYAHEHDVVHRDIKPDNILLAGSRSQPPHALVADFGIAKALDAAAGEKLTETGLSLGTPAYMSPEQATASRIDARADVYSLGCVVYEMLAGDPPFTGSSPRAVMARHAIDPVPALGTARPGIPPHVERAVGRALAKVPADRFASAGEFASALAGDGATTLSPSRATRRPGRPIPIFVAGTAILAAGAILLGRGRLRLVPPDASTVAIVPFRVSATDSSLAYLHEGMVDLLAAKLNGDAGPRSVDPRAVMHAWNASAEGRTDLPEGEQLQLARRLGAGRLLTGSVVGTAERVVLSAALIDGSSGRPQQQATVDGRHDSLPYLVDRLAGQLLALGTGVPSQQLQSLTSASLPALRAYLTGRTAARAGRWRDAVESFNRALKLDSTFALAGLSLIGASAGIDGAESSRGLALAWAGRTRLSPRDRSLLEALRENTLGAMQELVRKFPDNPEAWYGLGDKYYHDGALYGVPDAEARALAAFRRSLALDTTTATNPDAEPLEHFADLALAAGDSAMIRLLLTRALDHDSGGEFAAVHRLALARAAGDTAAIARWDAHLSRANFQTLLATIWGGQERGERMREAQRAVDIARRRGTPREPEIWEARGFVRQLAHDLALNRGRPREALAAHPLLSPHPRGEVRALIDDALYWDGDTTAARVAAGKTAAVVAQPPPPASDSLLHAYYYDVCTLEQWRLAHGDLRAAPASIARLQAAARTPKIRFPEEHQRCADLLDAWYATAARLPDARRMLARVDSLQSHDPVGVVSSSIEASNLLVARLWEEQGDWARAEAAARRRYKGLNPRFLSSYLREQGRSAALAGHREAAVRAYQHYLALRYDPEPSVRPDVEQVRGDLAELIGEGRR
jgi:serine/threonine-protein kinase